MGTTKNDEVIKHLEIIQDIINRLAHNSFLIKGWSMTILSAAILFTANITKEMNHSDYVILVFLIPVIGFAILDSYYLWQERLFRGIYNDVRKQDTTDFSMNIPAQKNKPKRKWRHSFFSRTIVIFYMIEILFIFSVFVIMKLF